MTSEGESRASDLLAGDLNDTEEHRRAIYALFESGESRFDGQVFVGVSSTGVYCRPVCRVRMPKFENCAFFRTAAEAERAGYRPCMLCRPELAPGVAAVDARASLARRAAALLRERCSTGEGVETLAGRLGYTDRHLRRAFEDEFGVSPVQYLQTCRLLLAKSLLTDTRLPVSEVARASGFGSVRRFNRVFRDRYRLTPTQLRKRRLPAESGEGVSFYLAYRKPYEFERLLGFFRARQLEGVELIDADSYTRAVRIEGAQPLAVAGAGAASMANGRDHGGTRDAERATADPHDMAADAHAVLRSSRRARSSGDSAGSLVGWVRVTDDPEHSRLAVRMSESLVPAISQVAARLRRQFDTDCDPKAVYDGVRSLDDIVPGAAVPGTRVPGAFDPFEISVRAVLGQQISVQAANKLAARIAEAYGTPVDFGEDVARGASVGDADRTCGLRFLFPTARDFLAMSPIEDALGQLGVIKARSRTIRELARLFTDGELDFGPGADISQQMERLLAVKGIGPWSANYIAMRALGYTDAFLEKDAGIKHALPDLSPDERLAAAEAWRPWRAYANLCLWNSLG